MNSSIISLSVVRMSINSGKRKESFERVLLKVIYFYKCCTVFPWSSPSTHLRDSKQLSWIHCYCRDASSSGWCFWDCQIARSDCIVLLLTTIHQRFFQYWFTRIQRSFLGLQRYSKKLHSRLFSFRWRTSIE